MAKTQASPLIVAFLLTMLSQNAYSAELYGPAARAGSSCTFGPYRFGAVGSVLPALNEPDKTGNGGNEVNQIYRIFFVTTSNTGMHYGFAGWITQSFDARYAFTPASLVSKSANLGLLSLRIPKPEDPTALPLRTWIERLEKLSHRGQTPEVAPLLSANQTWTAISPCFARPWNGTT